MNSDKAIGSDSGVRCRDCHWLRHGVAALEVAFSHGTAARSLSRVGCTLPVRPGNLDMDTEMMPWILGIISFQTWLLWVSISKFNHVKVKDSQGAFVQMTFHDITTELKGQFI